MMPLGRMRIKYIVRGTNGSRLYYAFKDEVMRPSHAADD